MTKLSIAMLLTVASLAAGTAAQAATPYRELLPATWDYQFSQSLLTVRGPTGLPTQTGSGTIDTTGTTATAFLRPTLIGGGAISFGGAPVSFASSAITATYTNVVGTAFAELGYYWAVTTDEAIDLNTLAPTVMIRGRYNVGSDNALSRSYAAINSGYYGVPGAVRVDQDTPDTATGAYREEFFGCNYAGVTCGERDFAIRAMYQQISPTLLIGYITLRAVTNIDTNIYSPSGTVTIDNHLIPAVVSHAFIDPVITFDDAFRAAHPGFALSLSSGMTSSIASAVPEPASWALMIGGFGIAGGAVRRRKVVAAAAA